MRRPDPDHRHLRSAADHQRHRAAGECHTADSGSIRPSLKILTKIPFSRQPLRAFRATRSVRVPRAITIRTEGPAESMFRTSRRRFIVAATAPAVLALTVGGFLVAHGAKANNTIAISTTANNAIAVNINAADVLG